MKFLKRLLVFPFVVLAIWLDAVVDGVTWLVYGEGKIDCIELTTVKVIEWTRK